MSRWSRALWVPVLVVALVEFPWAAPARELEVLVAPVRCVGDYLEAVAAAAPPRPSRAAAATAQVSELRWARARSYLAPRALAGLDARAGPRPLAPWTTLGRDGAFLGYEILAARRAPRGAAVVVSRERTTRALGANPTLAACAYLVGKVSGIWRIADKRCGRDFSNGEIAAGYQGYWDDPGASDAGPPADDWFGEDLE